jgi:hypothetical protein
MENNVLLRDVAMKTFATCSTAIVLLSRRVIDLLGDGRGDVDGHDRLCMMEIVSRPEG